MKFTGTLSFSVEEVNGERDGFAVVSIANSGPLIEKDELVKIFSPFYTKNKMSGTGLGLAIAQTIVENHGGKIWCESNDIVGTKFYVEMPLGGKKVVINQAMPLHSSLCVSTFLTN